MNASPLGFASTLALGAVLGIGSGSLSTASAQSAPAPQDRPVVLIYRCTDAQGRLSLRDSPCLKGERQDVRQMTRPKDASPSSRPTRANPTALASQMTAAAPQVLILRTPQPVYECAGPERQRYLSDTPEGKLRWVPNPVTIVPTPMPLYDPSYGFVNVNQNGLYAGYGNGSGHPQGPTHPHRPYIIDNGAWVRDTCYALPQAEACGRLREERGTLGRRRFNAQQTERIEIDGEERRIDARLAQECG
ncbi:MAG: hypothetical protein KA144_03620 [Xanthomonadaceae bacterium]|nr:hypothetical protein [Xanthomonadaceae bacterium]